jgi:hypothetical protein
LVTPIKCALSLGGFACRDDSNEITCFTLAVADEEDPSGIAHAKEEEAFFLGGVLIVVELNGKLVIEDGLGLLEGDSMLPEVGRSLGLIPFKLDHTYSVWILFSPSREP